VEILDMADIRVNGKRIPALQAVGSFGVLITRLDALAGSQDTAITAVSVNHEEIDFENFEFFKMRLGDEDTVEVRMETVSQMAFECMQVAQEMAELLVFDLKVATLALWDSKAGSSKTLETLLNDCQKFLMLAARPLDLLGAKPNHLPPHAQEYLKQMDAIANTLEDATLLAVNGKNRDACHLLVSRVMKGVERWLGLSAAFAEALEIDKVTEFAPPANFGQSAVSSLK
jgi:hypothetical protein